ncbi:MAG TPA: hypothetical protein VFW45_06540 [Candidatus Polarisedimenticolia bacterium]|nr:hypothetical protein [Candidatus Polarisedimenticolia bacterium]
MRRSFLLFALVFLAAAVVVTVSMAGATAAPKTSAVGPTPSVTEQFVMPTSAKPKPQPEVLCLVNICKVDNGVLYHCVANVQDNCCRYQTNKDCVADPNCSYTIPPYCPADPPNACNNTCTGQ